MNTATVLNFVTLFFAGILAGALFVIDYGVGPTVAAVVDDQSQIQVRQALIGILREAGLGFVQKSIRGV